jgi:curved DNA-binding protein CbpA
VARGAAPEVIAAAYRSLSRKYHPDHNLGDTKSEQHMKALNAAYAVLSDPMKRKEHDDWIASEEAKYHRASSPHTNAPYRPKPSTPAPKSDPSLKDIARKLLQEYPVQAHLRKFWALYLAVIVFGALWTAGVFDDRADEHDYEAAARWANAQNNAAAAEANPLTEAWRAAHPDSTGNEAQPASENTGSRRSYQEDGTAVQSNTEPQATATTAPNGSSWPEHASYVQGYERLNTSGRSRVTIDNSQNSSNAFVKLVDISNSRPHAVRSVFVPAYASFTIRSISPGTYDIRYKDLQDGGLSRSETFTLSEITEGNSMRYDTMTITLYKVAHGNMETYPISESDFSGI